MKQEEEKRMLKKKLKVESLGKVPMFFALINIDSSQEHSHLQKEYKDSISIAKYQTKSFKTSGYHKPISKII